MAKGTYGKTIGTIYDPAVGAPLDSRMMVSTFADLIAANTWKVDGGTSAESYAYYGMMVYVGNDPDSSKNGLYVLKASGSGTTTSDAKLESCWERISQSDSKIAALQPKAINITGITSKTVEDAFAEVAERLSGTVTEGNLEALSNRVSTVETDLSSANEEIAKKANVDASNIDAADWQDKLGYATATTVNGIESRVTTVEDVIETLTDKVTDNETAIKTKANQTALDELSEKVTANETAISTKASQADLTALTDKVTDNETAISTKASQADLTALSTTVDTKASQDALDALSGKVTANENAIKTKADSSTVEALSTKVDGKQDKLHTYSEVYVDEGESQTAEISGDTIKLTGPDIQLSNGTNSIKIGDGVSIDGEVKGTAVSTSIPASTSAVDTKLASEKAVATAIENVKSAVSTAYIYKGSKDTFEELPDEDNTTGDVWNVVEAHGTIPAGTNYAWNGEAWDALGGSVDLNIYSTTEQMNTAISEAVSPVSTKANANEAAIATLNNTTIPAIQSNVEELTSGKADVDASNITVATWKSKLGFITADEVAENQTQVDWNATTGISSIVNKPNINKSTAVSFETYELNDAAIYAPVSKAINGLISDNNILATVNNISQPVKSITVPSGVYQAKLEITTGVGKVQSYIIDNVGSDDAIIIKEVLLGNDGTSYITSITAGESGKRVITFANTSSTRDGSQILRFELKLMRVAVTI